MRTVAPEIQTFLDFVAINRRQGAQERDGRQRAVGFSESTVSRTVRTVDAAGHVRRQTIHDPDGIIAAWVEQVSRREHGVRGSGGGGARVKRKRERIFPKPRVWQWEGF